MLVTGVLIAGERFDGHWLTKLTCPAKGNTEGYTWQFPGVIENSSFRGEHGTAGQPGYLLIEGKIKEDGAPSCQPMGLSLRGSMHEESLPTRVRIIATTSRLNLRKLKVQESEMKDWESSDALAHSSS